jgi:hypothetical protein
MGVPFPDGHCGEDRVRNRLRKSPTSEFSGSERSECGTLWQHQPPTTENVDQCACARNVEPARKLLPLALPRPPAEGFCRRLRISWRHTGSMRLRGLHRSALMESVDRPGLVNSCRNCGRMATFRRGNVLLAHSFSTPVRDDHRRLMTTVPAARS